MQATVMLQALNQCSLNSFTASIDVYASAIAGFNASDTQVEIGETVYFTNTSQNAETYFWDFGDGIGSSTEVNPTYAFNSNGMYTVELTASNPASQDTYFLQIHVGDTYITYLPFSVRH
jgi:PKD repeat protein